DAPLERLTKLGPAPPAPPAHPKYAYLLGPESNAGFKALARLQNANVPVYRAARAFESGGATFAPGTWIIAPTAAAARILETIARDTGIHVAATDTAPGADAFRVKRGARIGPYRGANNMPGGWLMWLFEQYGFNFRVVSAQDFDGDLSALYDTIVLPSGLTRGRIVFGLDPSRHDREFAWAYGVGEAGWQKLATFVRNGGTLVAIGSAVETGDELLDLPIEKALPEAGGPLGAAGESAAPPLARERTWGASRPRAPLSG